MNPDYCNCDEFDKAVEFQDIRYYKSEDDRFGVVKKPGWYMYAWGYQGVIASLEPFKYCPWCAKKLEKGLVSHIKAIPESEATRLRNFLGSNSCALKFLQNNT